MMLMGKDYIDNNPKTFNSVLHGNSLSDAYNNYFTAKNLGYYRVEAIGGGGGGAHVAFEPSTWWWEPGLSGVYVDNNLWVDSNTIQIYTAASRWANTGNGGSPVQAGGNGISGSMSYIANGSSSYLLTASGRRGTRISQYVTNNNSSYSQAENSPWPYGSSGKAGNGGSGTGSGASTGSSGAIRITRIW